jgi:hypothetical protein
METIKLNRGCASLNGTFFLTHIYWVASRRKKGTLKISKCLFDPFTDALGEVMVMDLTQHMVYAWFDQMRQWRTHPGNGKPMRWTKGSVRNACTSLQAAFNWAVRSGLITKNPLPGQPGGAASSDLLPVRAAPP